MAHANDFIVSVQVKGRSLREIPNSNNGEREVFLQEGAEYSLYLKNKTSVPAVAHIFIDGTEAVDGGLVVPANASVPLERFVIGGNMLNGNRFKFASVRGQNADKLDDPTSPDLGLIEVRFHKQRNWTDVLDYLVVPQSWKHVPIGGGTLMGRSVGNEGGTISVNYCATSADVQPANAGGTITGSSSNQAFTTVSMDVDDEPAAIIKLRLRLAASPMQVSTERFYCHLCGKRVVISGAMYCPFCGRNLAA